MRDAKEIIEDMRTIVKPGMSEEFDYILELAEKGVDKAAAEKPFKTVQDVIDDLERQMMMTGAGSIDLSYTFEHKPYVFGVKLTMLEHDTAEVED